VETRRLFVKNKRLHLTMFEVRKNTFTREALSRAGQLSQNLLEAVKHYEVANFHLECQFAYFL
jgi:hypothetical protein